MKEELYKNFPNFDFFQAMRQLEKLYPGLEKEDNDPLSSSPKLRFKASHSLAFAPRDLSLILKNEDAPIVMQVSLLSLTGLNGIMPYHYTDLLRERAAKGDTAMQDFLDIFHHRLLWLFFKAWKKVRIYYSDSRSQNSLTHYMRALLGTATPSMQKKLGGLDDILLQYAGILSGRRCSAQRLGSLLQAIFQVPVTVIQFVERWLYLDEQARTPLGFDDCEGHLLSSGVLIGNRVWDCQTKFRLRIGPLEEKSFQSFLPGQKAYMMMLKLCNYLTGAHLEFDIQLVLRKKSIPTFRLTGTPDKGISLGFNTWLNSGSAVADADDVIFSPTTYRRNLKN